MPLIATNTGFSAEASDLIAEPAMHAGDRKTQPAHSVITFPNETLPAQQVARDVGSGEEAKQPETALPHRQKPKI